MKIVMPLVAGAVGGIYFWRKRMHGEAAFKVSNKLMLATTSLRDAIQDVRTPFIDAREYSREYLETHNPTPRDEADNLLYVYRNRWQPVQDAIAAFRQAAQEAEALFGPRIRQATDRLDLCVRKLSTGIDTLIENAREGGRMFQGHRDFGRQMRERVSALRDDDGNPLNQEIGAAINEISLLMSKHLPRQLTKR